MKLSDIPVLNAHACGGWRGMPYTNSKEALENSYLIGFRHIEVDVSLTVDNEYVIRHGTDFQEKYTKLDFLQGGTYKTSLTMENVLSFMRTHQDIRVMFDFHPGLFNRNCPGEVKRFASLLIELGGMDICQRSLVEVYSEVNALALLEIGFGQIIFGWMEGRANRIDFAPPPPPLNDFRTCIRFCAKKGIPCVSIPASYVKSHVSEVSFAKSFGLLVYSCGWQTLRSLYFAKKAGVDVATVDFLRPGGRFKNLIGGLERIFWLNFRELRSLIGICK